MLAIIALLMLPPAASGPVKPPLITVEASTDLKTILRRRLAAVEAQNHGVFHEDVSADVAPLFPAGQPFHETQRIVRTQDLGELKRFKGEPHDGTTMYVTHSSLAPETPDNVYVVIDFDFDGRTEADMRLKKVKAFLRASNM